MLSRILYTAGSIVALLVVLTIFFSIRPEGVLRQGEAAVVQAEVEAAGVAVSFTGKKAGADIPRVTGAEDFMAQYPFSEFTVEPVDAVPTGVYELARWRSSTAVAGHRTHNYSQATTSALWAMMGYNEYYIIEFPDSTHALALFDRGLAADLAKGKAVTLPGFPIYTKEISFPDDIVDAVIQITELKSSGRFEDIFYKLSIDELDWTDSNLIMCILTKICSGEQLEKVPNNYAA